MQGEMYNKVKVDDSFWTLEDGKEVSIALQKVMVMVMAMRDSAKNKTDTNDYTTAPVG